MTKQPAPPRGVRGEPNPGALRRTGKPLHILLPPEEHEAAARDAEARELSLAAHVRDLLERWRDPARAHWRAKAG